MRAQMRFPNGLSKVFTMSYDDGVFQDIRLIEIMKKNGVKGTFNINSDRWLRHEGSDDPTKITFEMAKKIYLDNQMEIATHGFTHPHFTQMPAGCVAYEILKDRETIEDRLGIIARGHAYPYGNFNASVAKTLADCGIVYARTTVATGKFEVPMEDDAWFTLPATAKHTDPMLFELAEKFLKATGSSRPIMFYLWGHSFEFDERHDNNWDLIERFLEFIGNRDDLWYATNIEIYDYVKAYRSLEFSAKGNIVHNPSAVSVWIDYEGSVRRIDSGETVKLSN